MKRDRTPAGRHRTGPSPDHPQLDAAESAAPVSLRLDRRAWAAALLCLAAAVVTANLVIPGSGFTGGDDNQAGPAPSTAPSATTTGPSPTASPTPSTSASPSATPGGTGTPRRSTSPTTQPTRSPASRAPTGPPAAPFTTVAVEAEAPGNILRGNTRAMPCAPCEGGARVAYILKEDDLTVVADVPVGGERTITVTYETDGPREIQLSINGGAPILRLVDGAGWEVPRTFQVTAEIPAGEVRLRFFNNGPAPDIDKVTISA